MTDYEDDIREHTEDEDDTQDEGDDPNTQNASFLLFLSQHGNESVGLDDNKDGKLETSLEKERKETKDKRADKKLTAVKSSAVGG